MRVCFITNFCPPYRAKAFRLLAKKMPTDFFFFSRGEEEYWNKNIKTVEDESFSYLEGFYLSPGIKATPALIPLLLSPRYDAVIKCINGKFALSATFLIAKLTGKKFILWQTIWYHPSTFLHTLTYPLLRVIQSLADAIVVYGSHGTEYLRSIGVDTRKVFIAWQAVDNDSFNAVVGEEEKRRLREVHAVGGRKVILYVGRLEKVKGLPYLIDAISRFSSPRPLTIMIGSGGEKGAVSALARERGVSQDILMIDHVDPAELYRYYAIADLFVLPSVTTPKVKEAWGLVINEAMNQSLPVVTTNAVGAGVGGLVRDAENGFVVEEQNGQALFEAMERLLRDDNLRRRLGVAARETIKDWTHEKMVGGFTSAVDYCRRRLDG